MKISPRLFLFFTFTLSVSNGMAQIEGTINYFTPAQLKEIRDSGFRQVFALRYYYDFDSPPDWTDSFYMARFDTAGRVIFEKSCLGGADSITYSIIYEMDGYSVTYDKYISKRWHDRIVYRYNKQNKMISREDYSFRKDKMVPLRKMQFDYDTQGRLLRELHGLIEPLTVHYFYDTTEQLLRTETIQNDSTYFKTYYEYFQSGRFVIEKNIQRNGHRIDSVISTKTYDHAGRLIEETRIPSPTYHRTFGLDCSTGDFICNKYGYDSIGRIIFHADLEHEAAGTSVLTASNIYHITEFNEFGYIMYSYGTGGRRTGLSIHTQFESLSNSVHSLRETTDNFSRLVIYRSMSSYLPDTIEDYNQNGKSTSVFHYLRNTE